MFSLNRAQVIGNLTKDPDLRYTPNGQSVASFSVATNRRWTGSDGQQQEDTQYHEIVAWGKLAEIAQQLLSKGKKVYVEGRLQTRNWEGPDGAKRNRTEIVVDNIIALSPRSSSDFAATSDTNQSFPSSDSKNSPTTKKTTETDKPSKTDKNPPKGDSGASVPDDDNEEIKLEDIPF